MKTRILERIRSYQRSVRQFQETYPEQWRENGLPPVSAIAPEPVGESDRAIAALRARLPRLSSQSEEFLAICASYPFWGMTSQDSFRMLESPLIDVLEVKDPGLLQRWEDAVKGTRLTPNWVEVADQDVNQFDVCELRGAIVLAASDLDCEPALLWIPPPREEYWFLSAWGGCIRFLDMAEAFDYLLTECEESIAASLRE